MTHCNRPTYGFKINVKMLISSSEKSRIFRKVLPFITVSSFLSACGSKVSDDRNVSGHVSESNDFKVSVDLNESNDFKVSEDFSFKIGFAAATTLTRSLSSEISLTPFPSLTRPGCDSIQKQSNLQINKQH